MLLMTDFDGVEVVDDRDRVGRGCDPDCAVDWHCHAPKRNGPPGRLCGRPKGWKTDHPGHGRCGLHGGRSPSGTVAAERKRFEAEWSPLLGDYTPVTDPFRGTGRAGRPGGCLAGPAH